mgnify:FL=1
MRYLKAKEIAEKYGLGRTTVYQWGQRGICPRIKIREVVRFPEEDFDQWFRKYLSKGEKDGQTASG